MTDRNAIRESGGRVGFRVFILLSVCLLNGCVGAVVGAAVDTTIEVAKVPFKVAGAAVDLISPDDEDDD